MPEATVAAATEQRHDSLRTNCGRQVRVGRLDLGDAQHPARRIFLDLGGCPGCEGTSWAGLTVAEARQVAHALLAEAAAEPEPGAAGSEPARQVTVRHVGGDAYAISVRGHAVLVDQPVREGGEDTAATPTELMVASLASCVAFYAGRYLLRHGLDRSGLAVTAGFTMAEDRPARISDVQLRISVPRGMPAQRRGALLAVASHCTVHNTLRHEPDVSIELDG